ncbi:MAG: PD-(D/E)XK nuclease family protein [Minicystis sp.]
MKRDVPRQRSQVVRDVAALVEGRRVARVQQRCEAVAGVAAVAVRTMDERGHRLRAVTEEILRAYDKVGTAPPLFRVAGRSEAEKPYNRLLGWLLTPSAEHGIALPALLLLARKLEHEALIGDLEDAERSARIEVRCETCWPEDAGSSKEPDLLVISEHALLLIENKLWSPESGDQYGPYRESLDKLATARNIQPQATRAHLLAPTLRDKPDRWHRSIEFAEIAEWLSELAEERGLCAWDAATCWMVAQTFARGDGITARVAAARMALADALRGPMTALVVRRLGEAAMLPAPFNPWKESR